VKKRDPHVVLGVEAGASVATVKAAWRRLARANHPDLNAGDPAAARAATARMVEINAAYEQLREGGTAEREARAAGKAPRSTADAAAFDASGTRRGTGGVPPPRPTRPVTAHLDTSEVLHARNRTIDPAGAAVRNGSFGRHGSLDQPARRSRASDLGPRRASEPTGPTRFGRVRNFQAPVPPPLDLALATEMTFGKFHGHTLGQIAAFEPSYIDWVSGTITRDPELVAAARVVRAELDRRGVVRRVRETHEMRSPLD
jgi:curved DNA-binding protein CbpA